jgi:hypothetical protein
MRQFRAPTIPFGLATHRCIATSASRFHHTILSRRANFIEPHSRNQIFNSFRLQADATSNLWQTHCLRGMVFARL